MVGKASLGVIQLIGGHTKVKEYPVRTADAKIISYLLYLGVISPYHLCRQTAEPFGSHSYSIGVTVDAYEPSRCEALCYLTGMACTAAGTVK